MYFNFEDCRPDIPRFEPAISKREGVLLSIVFHMAFFGLALVAPSIGEEARLAARQRAEQRALLRQQQARQERRFVFVQPRVDLEARKAPERNEDSDKNRIARALERARDPRNALPLSRGNSAERVDSPQLMARAQPAPEMPPQSSAGEARDEDESTSKDKPAVILPDSRSAPRFASRTATGSSALSEALRNLQRYVTPETFSNPQGGVEQFGSSIQFDTKGVEFGPWIRRFVAQIKRNWIVPIAAMAMQGHVVMTFYVHKDGTISELRVERPSFIEGFNNAAYNALVTSNPTYPLPPEYPSDRAFFTVTFYYNEEPPTQ